MSNAAGRYRRHRFPIEIISHAVWLYHRFCLSFRDVEDLLAERGVEVTYETIRRWCGKFGPDYARTLRRRQGRLGDSWFLDEVFVTIRGQRHYLWRAVDQDGDVIDILVQRRRNAHAAKRFFRKLMKGQGSEPRWLITDRLRSYGAAHRAVMPSVEHVSARVWSSTSSDLDGTACEHQTIGCFAPDPRRLGRKPPHPEKLPIPARESLGSEFRSVKLTVPCRILRQCASGRPVGRTASATGPSRTPQ
jgi:transposase-like protein